MKVDMQIADMRSRDASSRRDDCSIHFIEYHRLLHMNDNALPSRSVHLQ